MLRLSLLCSIILFLCSIVALPSSPRSLPLPLSSVSKLDLHKANLQHVKLGRVSHTTSTTSRQDTEEANEHLLSHSSLSTETETSPAVTASQNEQTLQLSDILSIAHSELRKRDVDVPAGAQSSRMLRRSVGETQNLRLGTRAYTVVTSKLYIEKEENDEDMKFLLAKEKRNVEKYTRENLLARGLKLRSTAETSDSTVLSRRAIVAVRQNTQGLGTPPAVAPPAPAVDGLGTPSPPTAEGLGSPVAPTTQGLGPAPTTQGLGSAPVPSPPVAPLPPTPRKEEGLGSAPTASPPVPPPAPGPAPPAPPGGPGATTPATMSTLSTSNVQNGLATNTSCASMIVVYAKGSFERGNVGAIAGPPLFASLAAVMGESNLQIQGVNYEAGLGGFATGGNAAGSTLMATTVNAALARCPSSKLVMAGYSQGAQLVHNAASQLPPTTLAQISSIVTFGDPDNGTAITSGETTLTTNVLSICHDDDVVCAGKGMMIKQSHLNYARDAGSAAAFVAMMSGLGMGVSMAGNGSIGLGQ